VKGLLILRLSVHGQETSFSPESINITGSVGDPGCFFRIPDLDFSMPDPGIQDSRNTELTMYLSIFNQKNFY
jgi:hypothetical protein